MAIIIPYDVLLFQILPWLPTISVLRFKCVSKDWKEFLSSKVFQNMHSRRLDYHQNPEKFLVFRSKLSTIDCEKPDNLTPRSIRPPKADYWSPNIMLTFLTSFHGLVCLRKSSRWGKISELILWNPMTSEFKKLFKPESHQKIHSGSAFGLFYSSGEDDYKLVSVISHNDAHIYSLKSDSWRMIAVQDTYDLEIDRLSQGTCLNENLYFLNDAKQYSVIRFDTKTETFTEMKSAPAMNDVKDSYHATLMVKEGCIHVFIMYEVEKIGHVIKFIELWKINEEGNWMKIEYHRVDPSNLQYMKPLHLTSNGNLLMFGDTSTSYFYKRGEGFLYTVDLKSIKLKKKKPCKGIGKGKESLLCVSDRDIKQINIVRYYETFVSPNQYGTEVLKVRKQKLQH